MLGIAASAAGAPDRMSEDWTQSSGTERERPDCRWASSGVCATFVHATVVYGMLRVLNCCSIL